MTTSLPIVLHDHTGGRAASSSRRVGYDRGIVMHHGLLAFAVLAGCAGPAPQTREPAAPPAPRPASANPGINDRYHTPEGRKDAVKNLDEPEREKYWKPDELIANFELKPGDVVADVAAGTGYLVKRLSAAVGPTGRVYEEDIQDEFLAIVRDKIATNKLDNVDVVLGDPHDTKLPAGCCDLVVVLDAYHHFEWPGDMLASIARALKPNGRLILVEYHRRPSELFTKYHLDYRKHMRLDYDGVLKELDHFGWKHVVTKDFLDYQFFSVFTLKTP